MRSSNDLLSAALVYQARGWSVIPLSSPRANYDYAGGLNVPPGKEGKAPLVPWQVYQTRRASELAVREWWADYPSANVGVILGRISGMIAIDIDDSYGLRVWMDIAGEAWCDAPAFRTGGGGARFLYAWDPAAPLRPATIATGGRPLSVLADGSYTVMPPSLHATGGTYLWLDPGEAMPGTLPPPPEGLLDALEAKEGRMRRRGGDRVSTPPLSGGLTSERQYRRAVGLAKSYPPAVQGQRGRVTTFVLACMLQHGLGLSEDDAFQVLATHYNPRCVPPWPEGQLRERVRSARNTGHWPQMPERPDRRA